jgi:hypothetical protein
MPDQQSFTHPQECQTGNQVWKAFERATGRELKLKPAATVASTEPLRITPHPPHPSRFVVSHRVRCGSLTASEHFRLHGTLPPEIIERLLDREDWSLELAEAINELIPALAWYPETVSGPDMERKARVERALKRVDDGLV